MKLPFLKHIYSVILVLIGHASIGQTAFVQFANNSADPELVSIDIWVDTVKLVDNLDYRSASDFVEVAASQAWNFIILDSSSTDTISQDSMYVDTFSSGVNYLLMLEGLLDSVNYSPFQPLLFQKRVREVESSATSYTSILFHNGSTDAGLLHVEESRRGLGTLIDSLGFGESSDYLSLESDDYRIKTYDTGLSLLSEQELKLLSKGLDDSAAVVIASGFLDPSSNNGGPSLNWFYVPDRAGSFMALNTSTAYLQVIHNSANPSLNRLDVYAEDLLFRNNLNFRSKSGYREVSSAVEVLLGFSSDSSTGPGTYILKDTLILEAGHYYRAVLNGVSGFNFTPNQPLDVLLIETGSGAQNPAQTDLRFIQGATDVSIFDVRETDLLNEQWIDDLPYGEVSDVLSLTTADYKIRVRDLADTLDKEYSLPLFSFDYQGSSLLLLASGFLDTLNNGNGEYFGMWLADSSAGPMMEMSKALSVASFPIAELNIYPNPSSDIITISASEQIEEVELKDVAGRSLRSISLNSKSATLELQSLAKGSYWLELKFANQTITRSIVKQ